MRFAREKPKFGWWQLNFEQEDCFLDNLMYAYIDRYHHISSFLYGCWGKMPGKKFIRRNWYTTIKYRGNTNFFQHIIIARLMDDKCTPWADCKLVLPPVAHVCLVQIDWLRSWIVPWQEQGTTHHENPRTNNADHYKDETSGILSPLVACNSDFFGILFITHS